MKSCAYGGGICGGTAIEGGAGYCERHAPVRQLHRADLQKHLPRQGFAAREEQETE